MKQITDYIFEGKYFSFTENEREALCVYVGYVTKALGDEEDFKQFDEFRKELSKEELEELESLYDCLEDTYTFKKVNRNMIKDDIDILKRLLSYIDDNDLWGAYSPEGIDAYDKLMGRN